MRFLTAAIAAAFLLVSPASAETITPAGNAPPTVAFASLPTCNSTTSKGMRRRVSDSNTTTHGDTVAGGGANLVIVECDGTNWKVNVPGASVGGVSDGAVTEAKLDINNSATDEYVLTYEADDGRMSWQVDAGGGYTSGDLDVTGDLYVASAAPTISLSDTDTDMDPSSSIQANCSTLLDGTEDCGLDLLAVLDGANVHVFSASSTTAAITIGSASVPSFTVATDGTGNSEVVLPNDSIGPAEIDNTTDLSTDGVVAANVVSIGTTGILFEGATGGSGNANETLLTVADPTADRTITLPNLSGTVVVEDGAQALTNKTIDAEGTGNAITIPVKVTLEAASCAGTTGTLQWDTLATEAPTATCSAGSTNTALMRGVAEFADSGQMQMQRSFQLPADFAAGSNLDATLKWRTAATANEVSWKIATACRGDGEVDDVAWNAASEIIDTAKGTTLQINDASTTNIDKTGCAAGETMHVQILRDPTDGDDDLAATASLMSVELTYRRAM